MVAMADRTSADLFGEVFGILAEHVPAGPERDATALRLWTAQDDYDFSPNQMDADNALMELGLARRGVDPDWPNDGEVWLYGPSEAAT